MPLDDGAAGEAGHCAALCLCCGGAVLVWLGGGQPPHTRHRHLQADSQGGRGADQPRHRGAAPEYGEGVMKNDVDMVNIYL